jgi:2-C-methyl-D-erythritol 4-phosphate cytidylyltransferase/2-C-methyl-D-erythritol 2,4-cyclodiphosphate synthase
VGGAVPKQLLLVGGQSILERSVAAFAEHPRIDEVIVALPPELVADAPTLLAGAARPVRVVAGGGRRQESVLNAFQVLSDRCDLVVIHDAARPLVSSELITRTILAASETGAAVAAVKSADTVKRARSGAEGEEIVAETLPRDAIVFAQTPQAFRRPVLQAALSLGKDSGDLTDEAQLAERAGYPVRIVEGEPTNIKITVPEDLVVAEAIARGRGLPARTGRAGVGYDLHRTVNGRPLVLGGVTIPFERGLGGHSDADVVCHAITDAILGAACAGDIGRHFPDTDPRWEGASSLDLLRRVVGLLKANGLEVGNVDATVVAERPKLSPYIEAMRANVAEALGIGIDRVSIKAKTNEGVDAVGRGEAMAAHAVALVRSA